MLTVHQSNSGSESLLGIVYAALAFLIWSLSPIYWKALDVVPALEISLHRMIWSFTFLIPLLILLGRWHEFMITLKNLRTLLILFITASIIGANWFLYIWAVNNDLMLQISLGYYINPLVNVVLGMVFLGERLRPLQILAVLMSAVGVLYLTIYYGEFPWVSLTLALAFGLYGLIHKVIPVSSLIGLTLETLLLSLPAAAYLIYLDIEGTGAIFRTSLKIDLLLIGTASMTALPLLFFILAARRIYLHTLGLLQYIQPSSVFLLAVFIFREPFSNAQLFTFIMIWAALLIFSADSVIYYLRNRR
jgi:chloramphenicol-sensitive protein RarD